MDKTSIRLIRANEILKDDKITGLYTYKEDKNGTSRTLYSLSKYDEEGLMKLHHNYIKRLAIKLSKNLKFSEDFDTIFENKDVNQIKLLIYRFFIINDLLFYIKNYSISNLNYDILKDKPIDELEDLLDEFIIKVYSIDSVVV